ncbi:MAG TPA: hypothetical protein PLK04_02260 [Bacillota bacterium]|jgi:hypothetical protein|nr:hypothetical protein [Bacillota bacterium]HOB41841.1 hypothetical protein [Bacillota bacterium]HOO29683.1 hypothetical protein [Bacillota bacterium]HPZ13041.1 hypothetical protein [Bacillota bacterium]HQD79572.1 hypothetical protein [Bacillota bacterium]
MQRCKRAVNTVIKTWCPLSRDDRTFIARLIVAEALCGLCKELGCDTGICVFSKKEAEHSIANVPSELSDIGPMYAAFVLFSEAFYFGENGLAVLFPALRRPEWLRSRYIFFRSRIPERALLETDRIAMEYTLYASGDRLNVEAPGGLI